mmetsp:Transcript_25745/g.37789  ORF Transcript_25745/g.37789 Transcript_25745/m.37789 type:complete len:225 (-) Transcript_25745:1634-2308(-)
MHLDDFLRHPVRRAARRMSVSTEGVEKVLSLAPIFIPPKAAGRRVMARTRSNGQQRVLARLAVTPSLNFEAQNAQLEEHRPNFRRHIPQILAADKHVRSRLNSTQILESILAQTAGGLISSARAVFWNFPHPEEAQDVVDAISVKILLHVLQPPAPPVAAILVHLVPVVGREPPVLLGITGRTCILVQFENVGLGPHILRAARDPDGQVALDRNSKRLAIFGGL